MRIDTIVNKIVLLADYAQRRLERNPTPAPPTPSDLADPRDERFYRNVARLHARGPRAVYEVLAGLGAERLLRTEIEELVADEIGVR